MPDLAPYINLGIISILALLAAWVGFPYLRGRAERADKADQERRDRAEIADQERRNKADQERRDQAGLLIQHLQGVAVNAEKRLEAQTKEFLEALARRDQQQSADQREIANALRGLTTAIDSLQRRQRP